MNAKQRIVACAIEELEQAGLEGFSLRSVSAAAGVTPMAIYRHFANREALLAAVGEEAFAAWQARVESIEAPDPVVWLRELSRAYVEFSLDEPARFDACFILRTQIERIYPQDFEAGRSPVVSLGVRRIAAAQEAGVFRRGDALERTMLIWAALHGLAMLHRCGRFAMARADFIALCLRAIDQIIEGMLTERGV